jgi:hypothetical protein
MSLSTIKQTLASGIERAIERATGLPVASFDFTPPALGLLFEDLPVVLVDDDFATPDVWDQGTDQRGAYRTYLEIELFCGLDTSDNGAASDALIHQMKEEAENYLVRVLQDGLPERGVIESSKVVGTPVETEDTGILMRYAWFRVAMTIRP